MLSRAVLVIRCEKCVAVYRPDNPEPRSARNGTQYILRRYFSETPDIRSTTVVVDEDLEWTDLEKQSVFRLAANTLTRSESQVECGLCQLQQLHWQLSIGLTGYAGNVADQFRIIAHRTLPENDRKLEIAVVNFTKNTADRVQGRCADCDAFLQDHWESEKRDLDLLHARAERVHSKIQRTRSDNAMGRFRNTLRLQRKKYPALTEKDYLYLQKCAKEAGLPGELRLRKQLEHEVKTYKQVIEQNPKLDTGWMLLLPASLILKILAATAKSNDDAPEDTAILLLEEMLEHIPGWNADVLMRELLEICA